MVRFSRFGQIMLFSAGLGLLGPVSFHGFRCAFGDFHPFPWILVYFEWITVDVEWILMDFEWILVDFDGF